MARERLERGRDFDTVVLGIPVGAFPWIAGELMDANPAFRRMVESLGTVRTQAAQLWFDRTLNGLGWRQPSPVLGAYADPLNTWADMSQLIPKESYPEGSVGTIAYLCGPMEGGIPDRDDHDAPDRADEEVRETTRTFLTKHSGFLWPRAAPRDASGRVTNRHGTAFEHLAAPDAETPEARFRAQFVQANVSPDQRYAQSLSGTTKYRLRAWESGFDNLVLTGDWIRNGFDSGAIEPTTWAGMQAAFTVSGHPPLDAIAGYEVATRVKYGRAATE